MAARFFLTFWNGMMVILNTNLFAGESLFKLDLYRVANKFSDTLNELFVVHWVVSKIFGENTKWKIPSSSHYLNILVKSINHGLSYSLKHDQESISKITFVPCFVLSILIQKFDNFQQRLLFVIQICIILAWKRSYG